MPLMPGLSVAFADTPAAAGNQVLVFLFLRFGMDGLSLLPPAEDGSYRDKRPPSASHHRAPAPPSTSTLTRACRFSCIPPRAR